MSKSWIVMSRNSPPEAVTYSAGGGAGSREVIRTTCGSPKAPEVTCFRTAAKFGSKRRLKPTWSFTPDFSTSVKTFWIMFGSRAIGFSQKICLPA